MVSGKPRGQTCQFPDEELMFRVPVWRPVGGSPCGRAVRLAQKNSRVGNFPLRERGRELPRAGKESCVVKLRLRDNESVQDAVRRFRKLVEHAGIKKELRKREFFEKPSEERRREGRRAKRRAQVMNELARG